MLQVNIIVVQLACWIQHRRHHRQASLVAVVEHGEARFASVGHRPQPVAQVTSVLHHVVAALAVTGYTIVQQLVVLAINPRCRPGEIQGI